MTHIKPVIIANGASTEDRLEKGVVHCAVLVVSCTDLIC